MRIVENYVSVVSQLLLLHLLNFPGEKKTLFFDYSLLPCYFLPEMVMIACRTRLGLSSEGNCMRDFRFYI